MIKYLSITKPGIIFGNIITVTGGFFLGAQGQVDPWLYLYTLVGISLIMASGCVFNNFFDRDIDQLMERTKNRISARGLISGPALVVYSIVLAVLGIVVLYFLTNTLTLIVALIGLLFYAGIYSLWFKRHSVLGTVIGSVSGAVPPVVGYCAATNRLDAGALILFAILSLWQMPHSYAIAIYRLSDYSAASIPVLPVVKGIRFTKISMAIYTFLFGIAAVLPSMFGYTGLVYLVVAAFAGLYWFYLSLRGLKAADDRIWARKMFVTSILIIMALSIAMVLD